MKLSTSIPVALVVLASTLNQLTSAQTTTSSCPAQNVFEQCKQNEDNYLKTCTQNDYACLCKWQTQKVSCWDTCPNDNQKGIEESLMTTYCSQPGANVTSSAVSSTLPSSSSASATQSASNSASASPSTEPNAASGTFENNLSVMVLAASVALVSQMFLQ
ncbi:hypothetical protein LRAMOSA01381 [Lichtheimia ramosa]|uniref:Extracellular membrane protein CFEM domain-containing protein n=1 Tax=Lichtheimia ramosa TaxID=688394 RepID=A0A077WLM4_9FUNG|nr:hypothetical protein LRAMOSA01381 [Lichtheimia ramosa]